MYSLLLKDVLITKKTLPFALLYTFFTIFAFQSMEMNYIAIGITITYILLLSSLGYDDKQDSDIMLNSLPILRRKVVLAKYISVFLYAGFAIVSYLLASTVVKLVGLSVPIYNISFFGVSAILFVIGFLASFYYPIIFKFGYLKSRIFNIFFFLLFFFVPSFVEKYFRQNPNNPLVKRIMDTLSNLSLNMLSLYLFIITLVIMTISYMIAINIYNRREF